jgi:peptide/nickel transport system ATP-binding protein
LSNASVPPTTAPLLTVENLRVAYPTREGAWAEVVRGVSFTLGRERLAIVGESGSGKSQTGRAIMGLSSPGAVVTADTLRFEGIELLQAAPAKRRALRGKRIAMILQDPKFALDPVMTRADRRDAAHTSTGAPQRSPRTRARGARRSRH